MYTPFLIPPMNVSQRFYAIRERMLQGATKSELMNEAMDRTSDPYYLSDEAILIEAVIRFYGGGKSKPVGNCEKQSA
jgi:hypothetical protein